MSINRYDARADGNQTAIVSAMRSVGATVYVIRTPVDLLVGAHGKTVPVEIKKLVGKRKPRAAGYTPSQKSFLSTWRGGPVATITDVEGALRLVAAMRDSPDPQSVRWPGLEPEQSGRVDSTGLMTLEGL